MQVMSILIIEFLFLIFNKDYKSKVSNKLQP